jgi:hypothetical protein
VENRLRARALLAPSHLAGAIAGSWRDRAPAGADVHTYSICTNHYAAGGIVCGVFYSRQDGGLGLSEVIALCYKSEM